VRHVPVIEHKKTRVLNFYDIFASNYSRQREYSGVQDSSAVLLATSCVFFANGKGASLSSSFKQILEGGMVHHDKSLPCTYSQYGRVIFIAGIRAYSLPNLEYSDVL
jgi:hypothetical protein